MTHVSIRAHLTTNPTQNGSRRGQRWIEGIIRGLQRPHKGRNRFRVDGVRGPNLNAHTHTRTRDVIIMISNKVTLWANVLAIFSRAPAHRRPFDNRETSSLRSDVCSSLKEVFICTATLCLLHHYRPPNLQVSLLLVLAVVVRTAVDVGDEAEERTRQSLEEQIERHLKTASIEAAAIIGKKLRRLQDGVLDVTAFALRDTLQEVSLSKSTGNHGRCKIHR